MIRLIGQSFDGTMAEKFVAPAANVLEVGDVDPLEAAAFGLTHLTAWRMLVTRARIAPDDTVLLTGIGGGVAMASLNIARHFGGRIIVTSRRARKIETAKIRGAHDGIVDEGQDWSGQVMAATSGIGVDVCADSVRRVLDLKCLRSLAHGGTLVTCGATTGSEADTNVALMFWKQLSVLGSSMGSMDEFREVTRLFKRSVLPPRIDSVHDASRAAEAYARLD